MVEVLPGNGLQTTLTGSLTAGSTVVAIQPADVAKWPASGEYRAVLSSAASGPFELVRVTAGQGTANLTVTRAVEAYNGDQTARAWSAGAALTAVVTHDGLAAALPGGITQAAADARYPLRTDPDPYPTYLTQAEGDARYQTPAQSAGLYLPLAGGTLTGNLLFSADNSFDIGASGATRPRDLFLGRNALISGTSQLQGNVGIGQVASAAVGLTVNPPSTALSGTAQSILSVLGTFSSAATVSGADVAIGVTTVASSFTMASGYALRVLAPVMGAGSAITTLYGLNVANQGATGVASAYGVYIANQTGASSINISLYDLGIAWIERGLGLGTDAGGGLSLLPSSYVLISTALPASLTGTSQYGIRFGTLGWNAPTANAAVFSSVGSVQMSGTAGTLTNHYHLQLGGTIPNGWAITNAYGINVANQGAAGVVNAYGIYVTAPSGATTLNYGVRIISVAAAGASNTALYISGTTTGVAFRVDNTLTTTIGAAGGAAAVPATPVEYLRISMNGVNRKIPCYTDAA